MSDEEQPREPEYAYVGRCRECGVTLAYRKDRRYDRLDVARRVAEMIAADLIIERVRVELITIAKKDCGCPRADRIVPVQDTF
jgi:hypothetical protein